MNTDTNMPMVYGGNDWGGNCWIWIILLLFLWGGGNMFGGNNQNLQSDYYTNLKNTMDNGFNAVTNQNFAIQQDLCHSLNTLAGATAQLGYQQQNCCCETNRNIDAVRYENAQNTCAITTNATANTQHILDKLCQMESNAQAQRIAELQERLQTANFQLSQQAQNATLLNALRPFPQPAYLTCSPYQTNTCFNGNY